MPPGTRSWPRAQHWNGVAAALGASEYFLAATLDITERVHSGKVVLVVPWPVTTLVSAEARVSAVDHGIWS